MKNESDLMLDWDISSGAKHLPCYFLCHYTVMSEELLHELGVMPDEIDEIRHASIFHETRIVINQCREIVKCLKTCSS